MTHTKRYLLGLAAAGLIVLAASAQPAAASGPIRAYRPTVAPTFAPNSLAGTRGQLNPYDRTRPIGGDWWRIYPWSPYNAWRNPYWYPPYNTKYPYPPGQAYPYNPYVVPQPYPVPQPVPVPEPWGEIGTDW
jgi:hypothetical protein